MRNLAAAVLLTMSSLVASSQQSQIARISALAGGTVLLNGTAADISTIEAEFARLKKVNGAVWYYRENPEQEPTPDAMAVVKLVVKYKLPISMSSKPDFSDYVDENGQLHPRTH